MQTQNGAMFLPAIFNIQSHNHLFWNTGYGLHVEHTLSKYRYYIDLRLLKTAFSDTQQECIQANKPWLKKPKNDLQVSEANDFKLFSCQITVEVLSLSGNGSFEIADTVWYLSLLGLWICSCLVINSELRSGFPWHKSIPVEQIVRQNASFLITYHT